MKKPLFLAFTLLAGFASAQDQTNSVPPTVGPAPAVETIVCIRHGEKPRGGLGQLSCRGLNRALALPKVLLGKFGTPRFIFAPDPRQRVDGIPGYDYVRPLATIEPTAIRCGLPVNTEYGYRQVKELEAELARPACQNATVFVAWEHVLLDNFAKNMVKDHGGDPKQVPDWRGDDYDMIFVFKITEDHGERKFSFTVDHEGLNGVGDDCP